MIAQVHKGEAIIPAAYNPANGGSMAKSSSDDSESASELREVKAILKELVGVISAGDLANVQTTKEVLKIVKRWDQSGIPEERNVEFDA